jgi:ClpP class serine protease
MAGKLLRLTERIYNTPHLMAPASLENAVRYLQSRNEGIIELAISGGKKRDKDDVTYNPDTGMGVISIDGPLTYIEYQGICGEQNASYQQIKEEFDTMLQLGAKTVVFDCDSPGGEAYGCFETAAYLRKKADESGVKLVGYVDGMAASAAYGLMAAMHEVVMNPMAEAGSIGVVVQLMNTSKMERSLGIERQYVYAGDSKVPFDEEGSFTEEFLADIQSRVDSLYQEFIGHVAEMRGIDRDSVKQTQAKVFSASKSVELGLADEIMTREEFFEYLSEVVEQGNNMSLKSRLFNMNTTEDVPVDMNQLEQMQAQLNEVTGKFEASQVQMATLQSQLTESLAAVAQYQQEKMEAQAQAAALKAQARKEKLSTVVQPDKLEAVSTSLSALDDEAFETVLSGFKAQAEALDQSALLTEIGSQGRVVETAAPDAQVDLTAELLKKQFNKEGAK